MLQQTQVATVIPYYERFIARFPDVKNLSTAHHDEVMHLWSGLGYYSRAINLHKSARIICQKFAGKFPTKYDDLVKLPGIGPSTAGAVLSLAGKQRHVILDANVKRVLARYLGNKDDLSKSQAQKNMWQQADRFLPTKNVDTYNQGLMDLGASICSIKEPECAYCPLKSSCISALHNMQHAIPVKKSKKQKPLKKACFFLLFSGEYVLLKKRPSKGIWANLWTLPEHEALIGQPLQWSEQDAWSVRRTTFTHYHLDFVVIPAQVLKFERPDDGWLWYNLYHKNVTIGIPAPITTVLQDFTVQQSNTQCVDQKQGNRRNYEQ